MSVDTNTWCRGSKRYSTRSGQTLEGENAERVEGRQRHNLVVESVRQALVFRAVVHIPGSDRHLGVRRLDNNVTRTGSRKRRFALCENSSTNHANRTETNRPRNLINPLHREIAQLRCLVPCYYPPVGNFKALFENSKGVCCFVYFEFVGVCLFQTQASTAPTARLSTLL
jgi:hypothetical protein